MGLPYAMSTSLSTLTRLADGLGSKSNPSPNGDSPQTNGSPALTLQWRFSD